MAKSKHIVFDIDGVLLDWHGGFIDWVQENYYYKMDPDSSRDTYDMSSWFIDMPKERFYELILEFNGYPRALSLIDGARATLLDFYTEGWDVSILTAFGSDAKQAKFRKDYLQVVFDIAFKEIKIIELGACKEEALKDMEPDVFVEDNGIHATKAIALGIKTYLLSYPFNQGVEGAEYVDTLYDIKEF